MNVAVTACKTKVFVTFNTKKKGKNTFPGPSPNPDVNMTYSKERYMKNNSFELVCVCVHVYRCVRDFCLFVSL